MKISRIAKIGAIAAATALALSACASNEPADNGGTTTEEPGAPTLSGTLSGVGASAQEVAQGAWAAAFQTANPDVTVDYDPGGSGQGRGAFQAAAADFAGSDRPFHIEEIEAGPFDGCAEGSNIIELPVYISPIAIVFSIDGIDSLNLDAETIAKLFTGEITSWNDPAIAATNPGVDLPSLPVAAVHRSDNSGTTENFTQYLSATASDVWTFGASGDWPSELSGGEAAQGTSGVISAVSGSQGTIGYADASRAGDLGTIAVKVGDEFVPHSPEGAALVVDASPFQEGRSDVDLAVDLDRNTTAAGAYPVILISYVIACQEYASRDKVDLSTAYLSLIASPEGQQAAAAQAGSAPLSDALRQRVPAAIDSIS